MKNSGIFTIIALFLWCMPQQGFSQNTSLSTKDYYLAQYEPFDSQIPSPQEFLGCEIGESHTRHDLIVAYFRELARSSNKASIVEYGKSHEKRSLVILTISSQNNLQNIKQIQEDHLKVCDPNQNVNDFSNLPIFVNLGYNVHGNEPSGGESALLVAYTLVASQSPVIRNYLDNALIFIDPTLNPDGRDRHTQWVNTYRAKSLVSDPLDAEHNEAWPRGRTNHYWFDLNRDWFLGVHPESQGKLNWYHQWYPNVITDVHEMGTAQTYFFEPMKPNGSKDPIMPKENYTTLNDLFATYYQKSMDSIGSFYFTKERYDGTYPGYGSSYPDLQGGLAILFEQASSRGHVQNTATTPLTFPFTIRNQYVTGLATVKASVENKDQLHRYQKDFFTSAIRRAQASPVKAYVFGDPYDENRSQAFVENLLLHRIQVYKISQSLNRDGKSFEPSYAYIVPTAQAQYRMVQSMFETYKEYRDSVFYDASAWSLANAFNIPYASLNSTAAQGEAVTLEGLNQDQNLNLKSSKYAYIVPWDEYFAPALLQALQAEGVVVTSAFKPFSMNIDNEVKEFGYGTLLIPVNSRQKVAPNNLREILARLSNQYQIPVYPVETGISASGIDLGSPFYRPLRAPKAILLIGNGVSSYEAGEVWHLLDTRLHMPLSKIHLRLFDQIDLPSYNTLIMVSGNYNQLDSSRRQRIRNWVAQGNTLITIRAASAWAIRNKLVKESLIQSSSNEDPSTKRLPYVSAPENEGKSAVGGAIFEVDLDISHPLGFGYHQAKIPVYRNSTVWLAPSKNPYSTVAKYTDNPHIDGFITEKNLREFLIPSASLIVSRVGRGRVVMFADNPNFRGTWWGTNRLFLNALFLGNHIFVPGN